MSHRQTTDIGSPASLDAYTYRASSLDLTRALVRYELVDTATTGQSDPGTTIGLALAHAEYPGSVADITDADIAHLLASVGE